MAAIDDPAIRGLLERPNHGVITTLGPDGAPHSAIVWMNLEDGVVAVNSAVGRRWPSNLQRDPRVSLVVWELDDPGHYVEIRGTARGSLKGADEHIDLLANRYTGAARFGGRVTPDEQRIKFLISPERVRYVKY